MRAHRFTLLLLMYVSLDLSSPFVPGAFNFNADESIDGVGRRRDGDTRLTAVLQPPAPPRLTRPPAVRPVANRPVNRPRIVDEWLVDVRLAHAPVPEASSPAEEH